MSALSVFFLIMLPVDLLIALGIGTLFFCKREFFWYRHDHKVGGKMTAIWEISSAMFMCFFLIFTTIHIWLWAPFSTAVPIFPFFYTWGLAAFFALIYVVAWMFPIKRAFMILGEAGQ